MANAYLSRHCHFRSTKVTKLKWNQRGSGCGMPPKRGGQCQWAASFTFTKKNVVTWKITTTNSGMKKGNVKCKKLLRERRLKWQRQQKHKVKFPFPLNRKNVNHCQVHPPAGREWTNTHTDANLSTTHKIAANRPSECRHQCHRGRDRRCSCISMTGKCAQKRDTVQYPVISHLCFVFKHFLRA